MSEYRRPSLKILVGVAHPHDFTHMAGTCAHHVQDGDQVTVVAITGGGKTHNERLYDELRKPPEQQDLAIITQSSQQYVNEKIEQFRQVCTLFGVTDSRVLPFTDVPLQASEQMCQTLAEIVLEVRPHLVLTHTPDHPVGITTSSMDDDHVEAGRAMRMAMRLAGAADANDQRPPHPVAMTYYMGVEFPYDQVDLLVDVTDQIENRLQAEMLFTSQGHTEAFARRRMAAVSGWGWSAHTGYAEPFVRAQRQISRKLLVTDVDLENADMSREASFAKLSRQLPEQGSG